MLSSFLTDKIPLNDKIYFSGLYERKLGTKTLHNDGNRSSTVYLIYLSINFLWNSFLRLSLMKAGSLLSGSALLQFLNTTSSSHRRLIFMSDLAASAYFSLRRGFPERMFSILILSSSSLLSIS